MKTSFLHTLRSLIFPKVLLNFGLQRRQVDDCYFWFYSAGQWARVLVYVDDVFYSSNSTQWRLKFEKYFQSHFDSDKMGIVLTALGAQIKRDPNLELSINLTKFITNFCEEVFTRTGTRPNNKPTMCPNSTKHPSTFARAENGKLSKAAAKFPMREIVGSCLWIVGWYRPDIAWTVGILSRFVTTNNT